MHHDISTITGEKVLLFTLAGPPDFREAKMKEAFQTPGKGKTTGRISTQ